MELGIPATPAAPLFESEAWAEGQAATFTLPTLQQQAAITELKDFSEDKIFAWLALIRSLEHGYRHRNTAGGLSCQQVSAISTLKDCNDSNIINWLRTIDVPNYAIIHRDVNRSTTRSSTSPSPRHIRRSSARTTPRSSTSSLIPSMYSTSTNLSTPRSSLGYPSSLHDLPEAASETESFTHTHWCPECGKIVDSCDGWKRHMKEHEAYYPCMPNGPVEFYHDTPTCALCGIVNPIREHLAEHNVALCISGSKTPARKSRKSLMKDHLAQHGILDAASASQLADKWQCKRNKRAFSCGFCVAHFSTITEQLNHIDNDHFKHGHDKSLWNTNVVIRGLLQQPKVKETWSRLLKSNSALLESDFGWNTPAAESLQTQLEMGIESGGDLALSAFQSATVRPGVSTAITLPVLQRMIANSASLSDFSQPHGAPGSQETPSDQADQAAAPASLCASHFHSEIPSWNDPNEISTALDTSISSNPPDQQGRYNDLLDQDDLRLPSASQQFLKFDDNYNLNDIKPCLSAIPGGFQSLERNPEINNRTRLQTLCKEHTGLDEAHLSFLPPNRAAFAPGTFSDQFFPNLSMNHEASSDETIYASGLKGQGSMIYPQGKPLPALPLVDELSKGQNTEGGPSSPSRPMDLDAS